jgi:hypothetical protein
MELFKALNKYQTSFSLSKSLLYKEIEKHKEQIIKEGFEYHPKTIETLFDLEIIYKSIVNKQKLEEIYYTFVSHNQDLLNHLTYQERQKIVYLEIVTIVEQMIAFKDNNICILIAYLEKNINQQYLNDTQMLMIKKQQKYLNEYPKKLENSKELYGLKAYISDFSSLLFLGEDGVYHYFYYQENRRIYIFDEKYSICDSFCIVDQYHTFDPSLEEVKKLVGQILAIDSDQEVIDYMHEHGFLSVKGYKKIGKKLG